MIKKNQHFLKNFFSLLGLDFVGILLCSVFIFNSCATSNTSVSRELNQRDPASDLPPSVIAYDPSISNPSISPEDHQGPSANENRFDWPVDKARFVRGFLPNKRRPHYGIDLAAAKGTSIFAAHQGLVIYVGKDFRGFGKMVLVESGYGWAAIYAHLDRFLVREGQILKRGDLVGLMGRTGRATGVHLHFEIRKDKGPVDPLLYLPEGRKVAGQIK